MKTFFRKHWQNKPNMIENSLNNYDNFFTKKLAQIENLFGALISYPAGDGQIKDYTKLVSTLKEK